MRRNRVLFAALGVLLAACGSVSAQSPGILYTWPGTGNVAEWAADPNGANSNAATVLNTTPGMLTITETGVHFFDPINEVQVDRDGGPMLLHDGFNRRREQNVSQGGLDLTGLDSIELDVSHTGSGPINVQFYMQASPSYTYLWGGSDPANTLGGNDWSVPANVLTTLRFPIHSLNAAQQAWITAFGISTRDHVSVGNVTWTFSEVRAVGAGLTTRTLASHDTGSSDNGLNGAFVNFEGNAVVGNDGGQNQSGLSQVTDGGVGSLRWTDKGNAGVAANPSGAAITWVNGTSFANNNSFYERLADFSNYNQLTFRMKATDVTPGGGGSVGIQGFFHTGDNDTGAYNFQVAGGSTFSVPLPIDGLYHDVVFSLGAVANLQNVQDFGVNLFAHQNDLTIDVDYVRFALVAGVPGDYNNNGVVDAADYVLWRKGGALQNEVDTPGTVNAADYTAWRARFGNTSGSGLGAPAVPEPGATVLVLCGTLGLGVIGLRRA
jgi:hypothetical protein